MTDVRLINTWDQLKAAGGGVAVSYHANGGRTVLPPMWVVWRINAAGQQLQTDAKAAWYMRGSKGFSFPGGKDLKEQARLDALAWATKKYGVKAWARNMFGDYVSATVNAAFPIPRARRAAVTTRTDKEQG